MDALQLLNAPTAEERLRNLEALLRKETEKPAVSDTFVNNHIHTTYSFSPYSPTAAVWFARAATLPTAGIMDHDSIAGAKEFIRAGELTGVATTVGLECRVRMTGTPLEDRFINSPDQKGMAYFALHGVPHSKIDALQAYFAPLRERRNDRNRKMIGNINTLLQSSGICLDFERDVLPLSMAHDGGAVTERHIIFALCRQILSLVGKTGTVRFITEKLGVTLDEKQKAMLNDTDNPYFEYDLLGLLKSAFLRKIYIPATEECLHISEAAALAKELDILFCYAYLGDVKGSVTGDKRDGQFEDGYLPELFAVLRQYGADAVTYMPSRNTPEQLERIQRMCRENGLLQISGEDINSPRQIFICPQLAQPAFRHLYNATWNLIERERARS